MPALAHDVGAALGASVRRPSVEEAAVSWRDLLLMRTARSGAIALALAMAEAFACASESRLLACARLVSPKGSPATSGCLGYAGEGQRSLPCSGASAAAAPSRRG